MKTVRIETTPPGASVYVNAVEDGEICKTPCPIEVDADATVIVELVGHKPVVEPIVIGRNEKPPYKRSYPLIATLGTIFVEGPPGAGVAVDKRDKGKAPIEFEIASGPHKVVVTLDGKELSSHQVEVVANEQLRIAATAATLGKDKDKNNDNDNDRDNPLRIRKPGIETPKPGRPRAGPIVALSLASSVGFRRFAYEHADATINPNLPDEGEDAQFLVGPLVEFWPGTLAGVRALRGLSVAGRFQLGVNSQQVTRKDTGIDIGAKTSWLSYEANVRQRFVFAKIASLELAAGLVRDKHRFKGEVNDIAQVPDADYRSARFGPCVAVAIDRFEPYLAAEYRVVLSAGPLQDRFMDGASIYGARLATGVTARFGRFGAHLEVSGIQYRWNIRNAAVTGTDGAHDSIMQVSAAFGGAY